VRPILQPPSLDHLIALSDDVGVIQHAVSDLPNRETGYCTDDVARAFLVAVISANFDRLREPAVRLGRIYLAFLHHAQREDGQFRNFMGYDRAWLDEVGTEDSNGRALWAIGYGMRYAPRPEWRDVCRRMLELALPNVARMTHLRSRAYAAIGLVHAFEALDRRSPGIEATLRSIAQELIERRDAVRSDGWDWFEDHMTYDNARLPEALLRIGSVLDERAWVEAGLRTLDFYESVVLEGGVFVPIGNDGWHSRGGRRARFGQQPLEAAAMIDACLEAYGITGLLRYLRAAESAFAWFHGTNSENLEVVNGAGCRDGLERNWVNENMGAESTLAYLASALAVAQPSRNVLRIAR